MESVPTATEAAGLSAVEIARALGLTPAEQKQVQAAGPGPRKAPKPRQSFSVRSLLVYCATLTAAARSICQTARLAVRQGPAQLPAT